MVARPGGGPLTAALYGIDQLPHACYAQVVEPLPRTGQARKPFKNINLALLSIKGNMLMSHAATAKAWNPCAAQPLSCCVPPSLSPLCVPLILV